MLTLRLDSPSNYTTVVLVGLSFVLAVAPWIGLLGDLFYIALFVAVGLSDYGSIFTFPVFGIFLIAVVWMIEHHAIRVCLLLVGVALLGIVLSDNPLPRTASEVVLGAIVLAIGITLRAFVDKESKTAHELATAREESRRALYSIRGELAAQLHDTIAKDLAQIAILAQNLAAAHPDIAGKINPLTNIAQDASRRLRPMIMDLNLCADTPSLSAAVKESAAMLRLRSITLNTKMVVDIDQLLSRHTLLTAALFVREAASNALKYGQAESTVELYVDLDGNEVALMMSNQISTEPIDHALTGVFGLANLQSRIESEGGNLSFASTGSQWIINATIPNLSPSNVGGADE
ncbi:sensor histidine kinase [Canibacter zhoujuaniae]|nr:histidine kinase [Canibacter zhoujuaniae]